MHVTPVESQAVAARVLVADRVHVVGGPGVGKSLFAERIAAATVLELHHLDETAFEGPEFALRPAEVTSHAARVFAAEPRWVAEGIFVDWVAPLFDRADVIVWLNYPALLIAYRLARRFVGKRAQPKSAGTSVEQKPTDAAAPAAESASWSRRLARIGRTVRERREYRQWLGEAAQRGTMVIELGNPAAAETWLGALASATGPDSGAG